jgi:hypothetical protein
VVSGLSQVGHELRVNAQPLRSVRTLFMHLRLENDVLRVESGMAQDSLIAGATVNRRPREQDFQ